jgi:hypothetical protein
VGLGIAGAVVGGFLYSQIQGAPSEPFSLSGNAWHGWIVAILGAMLVLWIYVSLYPGSGGSNSPSEPGALRNWRFYHVGLDEEKPGSRGRRGI